MSKKFFIATGEVSGEQHASSLIAALRESSPSASFAGMGGEILRNAGAELTVDITDHKVMGFVEIIRHIPFFLQAAKSIESWVRENKPDAVILIDNPGFNLRLAARLKKNLPQIKIVYYIAPKVWAWSQKRVSQIACNIDQLFCIFPFEEKWFGSRGVNAKYVGNPTLDAIRKFKPENLRERLNIKSNHKLISLFPGSRRSELKRILPVMVQAAKKLCGEPQIAISIAPGFSRDDLKKITPLPTDWQTIEGQALDLMATSDFLLAKSGTTTLEAALMELPMVVMYRSGWLTAKIAQAVVKTEWFSLPNIVAESEIVPELFQGKATPERIAAIANLYLSDPTKLHEMKSNFSALKDTLGKQPASVTAAAEILNNLLP